VQVSRSVEASREHVDEPFFPQRERRRFDIERCDGDEIAVRASWRSTKFQSPVAAAMAAAPEIHAAARCQWPRGLSFAAPLSALANSSPVAYRSSRDDAIARMMTAARSRDTYWDSGVESGGADHFRACDRSDCRGTGERSFSGD
jgi:hypothetical protein